LLVPGSPLISAKTNELIGITSYVKDAEDGKALNGNVCDSSKAPAVYVRVASYLDWIGAKTGLGFD
jgi:secreted trypsin-like serine protease